MRRYAIIAACLVVIIIIELFEWLTSLNGAIYNYSAGMVIGMAVVCILLVMDRE
jgi:hypothetical protein